MPNVTQLFDRQMIGLWLSKQGSICPLTGQPLVEGELKADEKVKVNKQEQQRESESLANTHTALRFTRWSADSLL